MTRLCELTLVLAALVVPSFLASMQGEHVGKQEAERTAKGMTASAAILGAYKLFCGTKGNGQVV